MKNTPRSYSMNCLLTKNQIKKLQIALERSYFGYLSFCAPNSKGIFKTIVVSNTRSVRTFTKAEYAIDFVKKGIRYKCEIREQRRWDYLTMAVLFVAVLFADMPIWSKVPSFLILAGVAAWKYINVQTLRQEIEKEICQTARKQR